MKDSRFHSILWIASIAFTCTRYICDAIMCAGALGDKGTYEQALEVQGPFLPIASLVCLFGALLLTCGDLAIVLRDRRNSKNKNDK